MSSKISQKVKISLFLAFAIICWAVVACWAMYSQQQGSAVDPIYPTLHGDIYSNAENFQSSSSDLSSLYSGGINTLLVANPQDAPKATGEALSLLAFHRRSDPVILICFQDGIGSVPLYGDEHWQTAYGVTNVNRDFLKYFDQMGAVSDNETLNRCNDLGALMTYFSYSMPGITVAPLVFDTATDLSMIESTMQKLRQIAKESSIVVMLPQGASEAELCSDNVDDLERYFGDENSDFSAVLGSAATVALTAFHSLSDEETEIYLWSEEKPQKLSDLLIVSGE